MNLSRRCLEPPVSVVKTAVEVLFCVCLTDFKAELQIRSVADPEFSKGGFQDSAREAHGEKLVRSRPLPVQTGGKNEELKMISVFL